MTTCGYTMPSRSELHREYAGIITECDFDTSKPNPHRIIEYTEIELINRKRYFENVK
jgi:hypothetical protein